MSTHKSIDKICCVILAFTLLLSVILMNAESFGIKSATKTKGYETKIFDTSKVHTIDIVMDDWDGFIENCTDEEYVACTVVIDNESYKNVALRAKGNTSLSNVKNYGNDRYSFKIEFDHYDSTKSYHGLDKLSLNNIIQDNTYIKDYLCYQLMGSFGANAPLCSFVQIKVNGEEWGLYLAVEGVEDSFLERNYGKNYGELYKPDSQSMGGGRGNGGKFNMDDWQTDDGSFEKNIAQNEESRPTSENMQQPDFGNMQPPDFENMKQPDFENMQMPEQGESNFRKDFGFSIENVKELIEKTDDETIEKIADSLGYADSSAFLEALDKAETIEELLNGKDIKDVAQLFMQQGDFGGFSPDDMHGGMGSDDVKLVYTDDNYSSYSSIFENAKTDITDADKDRLIASLKKLNENSDIENTVDIEEVIRYFVVHNFVCNFDSYTGSMIHNYYLYEDNGKLSMIPWDYNLAFGGFVGGSDATSLVNFPIDSPVSGGTVDSRPMLSWIFKSEEYTEMYHSYLNEFIESYFENGYFSDMIEKLKEMLSPYVQSDPTKFCTFEEFEKGIDTLKEFCLLRAESVKGQLDGTIPSTSDGQSNDKSTLVDASNISISDMGSMGNDKGGSAGFHGGKNESDGTTPPKNNDEQEEQSSTNPPEKTDNNAPQTDNATPPGTEKGQGNMTPPDFSADKGFPSGDNQPPDFGSGQDNMSPPEMPGNISDAKGSPDNESGENQADNTVPESQPDNAVSESQTSNDEVTDSTPQKEPQSKTDIGKPQSKPESTKINSNNYIVLGISFAVLILGLLIAFRYKKRA